VTMASQENLSEMPLRVVLEVVGTASYLRFESLCRMSQPFAGPELSTPSLCATRNINDQQGPESRLCIPSSLSFCTSTSWNLAIPARFYIRATNWYEM